MKWIDVKESLPKLGKNVLTWSDSFKDPSIGHLIEKGFLFLWSNTADENESLMITHWKPLPKPPKCETQKSSIKKSRDLEKKQYRRLRRIEIKIN